MFTGKCLEPLDFTVRFVGQDQTGGIGNFQGKAIAALLLIRPAHHCKGRAPLRFPDRLHGCHLGGLVLQGIKAVQVADKDLQGGRDGGDPYPYAHDFPGRGAVDVAQGPPGTDPGDQKGTGQH